jgi:hypothetical protein
MDDVVTMTGDRARIDGLGPNVAESPSLVLVINDTKLLMSCVKWFELSISNTCDEGVRGKEWWPQDHKEMVHGHEMMIMVIKHEKMDMKQSGQGKGITIGFVFAGLRLVEK